MTVSSSIADTRYAGDGASVTFSTGFAFYASSTLRVSTIVNSTGVETVKTLTTDYSVTGGAGAIGSVTFGVAPASGTTVVIQRMEPYTQETELGANDPLPASVLELSYDKLAMQIQQINRKTSTAVVAPPSFDPNADAPFTLPVPIPTQLIGWNQDGSRLTSYAPSDFSPPSSVPYLPLSPSDFGAVGDHQLQFRSVTVAAGSNIVTVDTALPGAAIGQYIFIPRAGASCSALTGKITAIAGTQLTLDTNASLALTAQNVAVEYGTDDGAKLQDMYDYAYAHGRPVYVLPGASGVYLTSQTIYVRQPVGPNSSNIRRVAPPSWVLDDGVTIKACAAMEAVMQYGDGSTYDQFIRFGHIRGGTIDCSGLANRGVYLPFSIETEISHVRVKNIKLRGFAVGSLSALAGSGGSRLQNLWTDRDFLNQLTITNVTKANPAVVTCADHNLVDGQVINPSGGGTMTQFPNKFYKIKRVDQNSFQLVGVDSSGWDTFTTTAVATVCMPSMRVPWRITGVTNANPCVVTIEAATALPDATRAEIHAIYSVPELEGTNYYLKGVLGQPTEFALYSDAGLTSAVDSSAFGTFSGPDGYLTEYVDIDAMETGVYYENSSDDKSSALSFYSVRVGVSGRPGNSAGYGQTHYDSHFYTYNDAEIYSHYVLGGKNRIITPYIDGPVRYGFIWEDKWNVVKAVEFFYNPGTSWTAYDGYPILNKFTQSYSGVRIIGGVMEGGSSSHIFGDAAPTSLGDYRPLGIWRANVTHFPADEFLPTTGGTIFGSTKLADNVTIYTPFNGTTDTGTTRAGIQFGGDSQTLGWYTADTFRGSVRADGILEHLPPIRTVGTTVGLLPSAATAGNGARAFVTDATSSIFGDVAAGSGGNKVPVYSDGTNWRIG